MKNILLLTNIYPNNDPDYGGTKVCHSFTKEWVKLGYNVRVVHFDSLFPRPYYWLGRLFKEQIQAKTGSVAYTKTPRNPQKYQVDDVPVLFVPLKKYIPHKAPSYKQTKDAFEYITKEFEKDDFLPDVVTAHFVLPQLQFLPLFKERYPECKTCLVMHGESSELSRFYPNEYKGLMRSVDVWGFRSLAFKNDFERHFGLEIKSFLCYSGIPEKYIGSCSKDFPEGIKRFVFVGSLYRLKNVDITLRALQRVMGEKDFLFNIVGSGAEESNLHNLAEELGIAGHVNFYGRLNRDDAQEVVRNSDCFVMVSSREAFGLVYIEAMAKGCIVIGTAGQGIDGIVKNGFNGFLCKSRSVEDLVEVISRLCNMTRSELKEMSNNAVDTASNMSDKKVAQSYINSVLYGCN